MADTATAGERKRAREGKERSFLSDDVDVILLDIEGTTTPISFVKDVLFPYARENVSSFLDANWNDGNVVAVLASLKDESQADQSNDVEDVPAITAELSDKDNIIKEVEANVHWQMDADRKTTALKSLQGLIWKRAYAKGEVQGIVFDDVCDALKFWKEKGKRIFIYSSGSVGAQKLLFDYCKGGSLLSYFEGHFDTKIGSKLKSESYETIADSIQCQHERILFLTDNILEAKAAGEARYEVALCDRPGNTVIEEEEKAKFKIIKSFSELYKCKDAEEQQAKVKRADS